MADVYRIHGDNIVECERIAKIIIGETNPPSYTVSLLSPSTIVYSFDFDYCGQKFSWELRLLPGFNKSGRERWEGDIFKTLSDRGSFLDETPDAVITNIDVTTGYETILCAIEFCSALQAGNQAWQRSGRAMSTGRAGCPYLYVIDFVNYELDPKTRERKALRFPNPAVSYSYVNYSHSIDRFVVQVYVRSEEFDKALDGKLGEFDESNFGDAEMASYIVKLMCGFDTAGEEVSLINKNMEVVYFLSEGMGQETGFTKTLWQRLAVRFDNIVDFSLENSRFSFHKKISSKGHHGLSREFQNLTNRFGIGIAVSNLPFGVIPANRRREFAEGVREIYPDYDDAVLEKIAWDGDNLIVCIIKGFKPGGDDNRPDRGVLPFATMLTSSDNEVLTYIYGPVNSRSFKLLIEDPLKLAESNGLWKSLLSLSDYLALDVPVLGDGDESVLLDSSEIKKFFYRTPDSDGGLSQPVFSDVPKEFHEDDVDTGIHFLFSHVLRESCFEGMCNPPGGDWSGMSLLYSEKEARWLSLPRVSADGDGKRPDHVLEIFGIYDKPVLLFVESKERSSDLERDVGAKLVRYMKNLMKYVPSAVKNPQESAVWKRGDSLVDSGGFVFVSAAAYLKSSAKPSSAVFSESGCDLLFVMEPADPGWRFEMIPRTGCTVAENLKSFVTERAFSSGTSCVEII